MREIGGISFSNNNFYVSQTQSRADDDNNNGRRTSNFVVNESTRSISENVASDGKFIGISISANNNVNSPNGGDSMLAMPPVTIDYPHLLSNDTMPLTSSASTEKKLSPFESLISNNNVISLLKILIVANLLCFP